MSSGNDLLFGTLALQLGFVDRGDLQAAIKQWKEHQAHGLDRYLLQLGVISADRHKLLQSLVEAQLEMHQGDAEKSLASLASREAGLSSTEAFESIGVASTRSSPSHINLGALHLADGKPEDALSAWQSALAIQEGLARGNPREIHLQQNLAGILNNIGIVSRDLGKNVEALAAYENARTIQERLAIENPSVMEFQSGLGGTLHNVAIVESALGLTSQARDHLRDAISLQRKALAADPMNETYRRLLRNHLTNLNRIAAELADDELRQESTRGFMLLEITEPVHAEAEAQIRAALAGEVEIGAEQLVQLGKRANETMRYALAVKLWTIVHEKHPEAVKEFARMRRYQAACAAALAAERAPMGRLAWCPSLARRAPRGRLAWTLSPSHPLTLSSSHPLTLSPSHPLTLSSSHPLTLSPPLRRRAATSFANSIKVTGTSATPKTSPQ